jgi:hypothetical protein
LIVLLQAPGGGFMSDQATIGLWAGTVALFMLVIIPLAVYAARVDREANIRDDVLAAKLALVERSSAIVDKVFESRILASFTEVNPITPAQAAHIAHVRRHGMRSPFITNDDIEEVLRIIDNELDHDLIEPARVGDAKFTLLMANAELERRRALAELPEPIRRKVEGEGYSRPWWRPW